ncbi:MAG: ABC transporter permease, partial [Lachnospiraceae bacterium]|nr:ABC transporter permease [Lachnospiraceae bacterium]
RYSIDEYFADTNFKDLDIQGDIFNASVISMLENMEGVKSVNGIRHGTGKVNPNGTDYLAVISYIDKNDVSSMLISEGEEFIPGAEGVWVEEQFAKPLGIHVGDVINIQTENVNFKETVRGIGYCPEYLYYVPNDTYPEPVYGEHAFLIMDISQAPGEVYFDQMIVDLTDVKGQSESLTDADIRTMEIMRDEVAEKIDNRNVVVKTKTEDELYHLYVGALNSSDVLATVFPTIFLAVACLGIVSTMTRLTSKQRTQIGTLKALGFSRKTITLHYLSYSFVISAVAAVLGVFLGDYLLGSYLTDLTLYYYQNPYMRIQLSFTSVYMALIAVGLCVLITFYCTRHLLKENASDILRPEAPKGVGSGFFEKTPMWKMLAFGTRWNIRDVRKNKLRTLLSVSGVMVCSMLLFAAVGFYECMEEQVDWMYDDLILANSKITFEDSVGYGTVSDYAKEYHGQMVQFDNVTIYTKDQEYIRFLMVVDEGNLYRIMDEKLSYVEIPKSGVLVTTKTAENLNLQIGDEISWRIPGDRETYKAKVSGFIRQATDQGILLSRAAFEEVRGEFRPSIVYTMMSVPKELQSRPEIVAVNDRQSLKDILIASHSTGYAITGILIVMAVMMGVVVLYNLGVLSYAEKIREIATMKVLGFQSMKIRMILMQQNLTITGIGAVLGIPAGWVALKILVDGFTLEDGDMVIRLSAIPYLGAVVGAILVSVLVNLYVTSKVNRIDMVEALKGVE